MRAKTRSTLGILVVEDDDNWREALCTMYKDILGKAKCRVNSTRDPKEAIELLGSGAYQLLSVDINLSALQKGGNGMEVLEDAAGEELVNGVVVITGVAYDEQLEAAVLDEGKRQTARMALGPYVSGLFNGRSTVLFKDPVRPVQEQVKFFQKYLLKTLLRRLSSGKVRHDFPPPYVLSFQCRRAGTTLIVKRYQGGRDTREVSNENDVRFLETLAKFRMGMMGVSRHHLTKEEVVRIYRGTRRQPTGASGDVARKADTDIETFRGRLVSKSIRPEHVFEAEWGKGWRLLPESRLQVEGLGDIRGGLMGNMSDVTPAQATDEDAEHEENDGHENESE